MKEFSERIFESLDSETTARVLLDEAPRWNPTKRELVSLFQPGREIASTFYAKHQEDIAENSKFKPETFIGLHRFYSKQMNMNSYDMQN
jgi:hypothetical protein